MTILEIMLNILFPEKCAVCGKLGESICLNCYDKLKKLEINNNYKDIFFLYKYQGVIRNLILSYKFKDKSYLYKTFSKCMLKNKNLCNFLKSYDIIIPVPLHKKRKMERGYNQSALIAKDLAKNLKLKYYDILIKNTNTKPQSSKSLKERKESVVGIYEIKNKSLVKGKSVVIFDDIYTTGSTLEECKKVLLKCKAKKVGLLALAKDYID